MWCYRKLFKMSWVDEVTNKKVSNLVKEKRIKLIMWSKEAGDRLMGHTLRQEGLVETILKGTVDGRKMKGRQRLEYVKQIIDEVGSV